jgi:hypothetical protein
MKLFIILQVISGSSRLAQLAWVTAQQRDNLNRLIVAHPDCSPAICCQRANTLDNTVFVDGYKVLGFQVISFTVSFVLCFVKYILSSPFLDSAQNCFVVHLMVLLNCD